MICNYFSFFSFRSSEEFSVNAIMQYEIRTIFAARAARPPFTTEFFIYNWDPKKVTNGNKIIRIVVDNSLTTTDFGISAMIKKCSFLIIVWIYTIFLGLYESYLIIFNFSSPPSFVDFSNFLSFFVFFFHFFKKGIIIISK